MSFLTRRWGGQGSDEAMTFRGVLWFMDLIY